MKSVVLGLAFVLGHGSPAFATWSVIALDAGTGQVIIASATCVRQGGFPQRQPNAARDLMDVQAVIVPGLGVAACQAGVDNTRENQMLVYNELKKGTPPPQIIELLKAQEAARKPEDQMERRQFGILAMPERQARSRRGTTAPASTGAATRSPRSTSADRSARCSTRCRATRLLGDQVVHMAALAFTRANGTMADRVMAAMEAADQYGGDHRCNCGNNPLDFVPCDGKTAHVAYIAIAEKTDKPGITHNDGQYFAYISVTDDNTQKGESGNPVKTLRLRYDAWKKAGSGRTPSPGPTPFKPASR